MDEPAITSIIEACLAIDIKARDLYQRFAQNEKLAEQKTFWEEMAVEEGEHTCYWGKLLLMARQGHIPQIFTKPADVLRDLERIIAEINEICTRYDLDAIDAGQAFALAFTTEFYSLYPAFGVLFHYLKTIADEKTPEDEYHRHIAKLLDAFHRHRDQSMEMDILGRALASLWEANRLLAEQGATDPLTGLLNRRGFLNAATPLANLAKRNRYGVGLLLADIDRFKEINDRRGHQDGDRTLEQIAGIIKNSVRKSDLVSRYGGEEFVVLMIPADPDALPQIGEKIRAAVERETRAQAPATVSIGMAFGTINGDVASEIESLVKRADHFLYQAKKGGRNRVVGEKNDLSPVARRG